MHRLVSLLPEQHARRTQDLREQLDATFGLNTVRNTLIPHFTWQAAQSYDFEHLNALLAEISSEWRPFPLTTAGIGMFTGRRPVLYIPIVKTAQLLQLHQRIWQETQAAGQSFNPLFLPESWLPYIVLAAGGLNESNITEVLKFLSFRPFTWEMSIDNLTVLYQTGDEVPQVHSRHLLTSPDQENNT